MFHQFAFLELGECSHRQITKLRDLSEAKKHQDGQGRRRKTQHAPRQAQINRYYAREE